MTRHDQIAIEPRIQQGRSVHLHFERAEIAVACLGSGLQVQAGRIGVCTDDMESVVGPHGGDEGNQRSATSDESLDDFPGEVGEFAALVEPNETSIEEAMNGGCDDVMRSR